MCDFEASSQNKMNYHKRMAHAANNTTVVPGYKCHFCFKELVFYYFSLFTERVLIINYLQKGNCFEFGLRVFFLPNYNIINFFLVIT